MKRAVAALLVLAVVFLAGGLGLVTVFRGDSSPAQDEPWQAAPREPGADRPPREVLRRFYDQRLDWGPCGDHDCARLRVPLDYDQPRGRTIDLAVLRVRAQGAAQGALVVNPGGPGAPGTSYAANAPLYFRQPLLRAYDVVGFDPRGTGSSAPVECLSDSELDGYLAQDPSPDDPSEVRELVGSLNRFGRGCVEGDAELAAHVSTIEAARDMDVLRAALGQRKLDYFGASYGTKLGATYAELFPKRAGRLVLDGAVDVTLSTRAANLGQAGGFETALRAYVADCVETVESCYLGDSVAEGLGRISDFLEEVDHSPLPTGSDRPLTVGNAFYGIVMPLYHRDYWFLLSQALQAGFGGDGSALLRLADLYVSRGPDGYTNNSSEAFLAISCLDDPDFVRPREVPGELAAFRAASPTLGDVFAWAEVSCIGQVAESTEQPLEIDGSGADPILVVGTTRDPATPYEWAEALADQLDSAVLLTRDGDGHTGYNAGNRCVDETVEAYLVSGTVPEDGRTC